MRNNPKRRAVHLVPSNKEITNHVNFSFDQLVSFFLSELRIKNLSPRSLQFYEENLNAFQKLIIAKLDFLDVSTLTYQDIKQHYIGSMLDKKLAGNTINGRIKTLKAFYSYLFRENYTKIDLAKQLQIIKAEKKMITTFSKNQMILLLEQPDRTTFVGLRDYTMMLVLLETGLRLSELIQLRVDDVRWAENEIYIYHGKGGHTRRVPFQKTCGQALRHYLKERGNILSDFLFITVYEKTLHPRTFQENISTYGKSAGLRGVRVSPHTFRHSMAKFYILNGGDPFTLQQILGHSTLDMVRHYVQLFRSDVQEQHKKFSPVENIGL
jgi:integrase/recombinase XerD